MYTRYSPDLSPSDYYPFQFMANDLAGKIFVSSEMCENRLFQFIANSDKGFYKSCILDTNWNTLTMLNKTFNQMQKQNIAFY